MCNFCKFYNEIETDPCIQRAIQTEDIDWESEEGMAYLTFLLEDYTPEPMSQGEIDVIRSVMM